LKENDDSKKFNLSPWSSSRQGVTPGTKIGIRKERYTIDDYSCP